MSQKHKKLLQRQEGEMQNKVNRGEAITETTVKNMIKLNAHPKVIILSKFLTSH